MNDYRMPAAKAALDSFVHDVHTASGGHALEHLPKYPRQCPIPNVDGLTEHTLAVADDTAMALLDEALKDLVLAIAVAGVALAGLSDAVVLAVAIALAVAVNSVLHVHHKHVARRAASK